jgi:hypothetical protein
MVFRTRGGLVIRYTEDARGIIGRRTERMQSNSAVQMDVPRWVHRRAIVGPFPDRAICYPG